MRNEQLEWEGTLNPKLQSLKSLTRQTITEHVWRVMALSGPTVTVSKETCNAPNEQLTQKLWTLGANMNKTQKP